MVPSINSGPFDTDDSIQALLGFESPLWLTSILTFGVGDLATTLVGIQFRSVVEAGPVAAYLANRYGLWMFIALKLGTFALLLVLWRVAPRPHNVGIPLGLAILGVLVTGWNLVVLGVAAGAPF